MRTWSLRHNAGEITMKLSVHLAALFLCSVVHHILSFRLGSIGLSAKRMSKSLEKIPFDKDVQLRSMFGMTK